MSGTTGWFGRLDEVAAAYKQTTAFWFARELFDQVRLFARLCAGSGRAVRRSSGLRSLGLGDPSFGERRAFRHAADAGGPDARRNCTARWTPPRARGAYRVRTRSASTPPPTITLRHTARSREGFARGALFAAKWLEGRRGVYDFSEALFGAPGEQSE
ncbi:MAG: hypothetical protein HS123_16015 [Solibacteraceae bacterium]|nr:hypothetical protein [Solibacteraceae bacterium]